MYQEAVGRMLELLWARQQNQGVIRSMTTPFSFISILFMSALVSDLEELLPRWEKGG